MQRKKVETNNELLAFDEIREKTWEIECQDKEMSKEKVAKLIIKK